MSTRIKLESIPTAFGQELFEKEDEALRGEVINICFTLPTGSQYNYKVGTSFVLTKIL